MSALKKGPIAITVVYIVVCLTVILCRTFLANPPFFNVSISLVCFFVWPLFFLLNLRFAVFQSQFRVIYVLLSVIILVMPYFNFHHYKITGQIEHRWFFENGLPQYNQMVDKILTNQPGLTSGGSSFDKLVGRPGVFGWTNTDGSVVIQFQGRHGYWRIGYLYYNGLPVVNPRFTNDYDIPGIAGREFIHLTNYWYEY